MFVLIWLTLLFSVRGSDADTERRLNSSSCHPSAELPGRYTCTAKHQITNLNSHAEVTVTWVKGFPLPTIKLLLSENRTECSITNVSNHTVDISVIVSVKDLNNTTVGCVSNSNVIKEAETNLTTKNDEFKLEDLLKELLITVQQPQVIIAFLIGILLSATICCLATKCHRKKRRSSRSTDETLEMVTTQLMDAGQSVGNNGTHDQEAAGGGAEAAGLSVPDGNVEPREVEYSNIDFSRWNRKNPAGSEEAQKTVETEYAEIKKEETEDRQDNGGEEGEMLEGSEVAMMGEDQETKQCVSAEEEDAAVYSSVNEMMAEF